MVNKKLLEESLNALIYNRSDIKKANYNKDLFNNLFNEFNSYKMKEKYYYCSGIENSCWFENIEEGVWDFTLEQVKENILEAINKAKKYLYNGRKYGPNRLHIYKDNNECYVFIYLRDILGIDYNIWFFNK